MKKIILGCILLSLSSMLRAQLIEIDGKALITSMDTVYDETANVVWLTDGTLAIRQYKIGDMAHGGIVFFVDESGEHGLVADTADLSSGIRWYAGTNGSTQAKGDGPFAGEMNTSIIISSQVALGDDGETYAARLCSELKKGGYGDWYLPSKEELNMLYNNLYLQDLGGFESTTYWSSTEYIQNTAFQQNFANINGMNGFNQLKSSNASVRAVRAF